MEMKKEMEMGMGTDTRPPQTGKRRSWTAWTAKSRGKGREGRTGVLGSVGERGEGWGGGLSVVIFDIGELTVWLTRR